MFDTHSTNSILETHVKEIKKLTEIDVYMYLVSYVDFMYSSFTLLII